MFITVPYRPESWTVGCIHTGAPGKHFERGVASCRSEMAQKIAANDLAESVMAFNSNYSDSGLFGVYAVAKVRLFCFRPNAMRTHALHLSCSLPPSCQPLLVFYSRDGLGS